MKWPDGRWVSRYLVLEVESPDPLRFLMGRGMLWEFWQQFAQTFGVDSSWRLWHSGDIKGEISARTVGEFTPADFEPIASNQNCWFLDVSLGDSRAFRISFQDSQSTHNAVWNINLSVGIGPGVEAMFVALCDAVVGAIDDGDLEVYGQAGHSSDPPATAYQSSFFRLGKVWHRDVYLDRQIAGIHWLNLVAKGILEPEQAESLADLGANQRDLGKVQLIRFGDRPMGLDDGAIRRGMEVVGPSLVPLREDLPDRWWYRENDFIHGQDG